MPLTCFTYKGKIRGYYTVQYSGALKRRPDLGKMRRHYLQHHQQKLQCIWATAVNHGVTISAIDFSCVEAYIDHVLFR